MENRVMGIDPAKLNDQIRSRMIPADRKKLGKRGVTFAEADDARVIRTERDIHNKFISFLRRHELPYTHSNPTRKTSINVGHPDFLVGLRGNRGFYIEFKVPPNGLSKLQTAEIRRLADNGNTVVIAEETSSGAAYTTACKATVKFFNLDLRNEC